MLRSVDGQFNAQNSSQVEQIHTRWPREEKRAGRVYNIYINERINYLYEIYIYKEYMYTQNIPIHLLYTNSSRVYGGVSSPNKKE
jgi:hypothetical protein